MTATLYDVDGEWVDDVPDVHPDAPIGWTVTGAGWLETPDTLTTREAAELLEVHPGSVDRMARTGRIRGVRLGGYWVLDRASVDAYVRARQRRRLPTQTSRWRRPPAPPRRAPRPEPPRLPAGPLLGLVDSRGGPRALGLPRGSAEDQALYRARKSGRVTREAADRLACRVLNTTPWAVWGAEYDE